MHLGYYCVKQYKTELRVIKVAVLTQAKPWLVKVKKKSVQILFDGIAASNLIVGSKRDECENN